jgi:tetratricopeptide (TPR) repeat protein
MKTALVALALGIMALSAAGEETPESLIDSEHWRRALALVEPLLKSNPDDARANFLMARCLEAAGRYDDALSFAERASRLEPKNADYRVMLALVYGRQAIQAGILRKLGLAHRIRRESETALQLNPNHVEARLILLEYFYQAPGIVGGDKAKARRLADEVVRLDPVRGYVAQASLARRDRKPELIESFYAKALDAVPGSYQALTMMSGYFSRGSQSNPERAEKYAREAAAVAPDRIAAYVQLAQIYYRQERWADLDDILARAEAVVPDNLNPFFQAGRAVLQQGKYLARAERYFRQYLDREPELNAPSHAQAYWRLAQTLDKMGRTAEAVESLQAALKLEPDLRGAKQDLKRLNGTR